MTIKEFLEERLEYGGFKRQYELGMKLGISSGMLSKYLSGHTKIIGLEKARELYKRYNVELYPYSKEALND